MDTNLHRRARFGDWLAAQLARREWNQSDLARRVDVRPAVVSRWVRGERIPSPASVELIADVLFEDVDEVLTLAGHRPRMPRERLDEIRAELDPLLLELDASDLPTAKELLRVLVEQKRAARRAAQDAAVES